MGSEKRTPSQINIIRMVLHKPIFGNNVKTKSFVNGISSSPDARFQSKALRICNFRCGLVVWDHTEGPENLTNEILNHVFANATYSL